jgi:hypothetical protein
MEKKLAVQHFIAESIIPVFNIPPKQKKTPHCPDGFIWHELEYTIKRCFSEWRDFSRHGRMSRNMEPQHAQAASQRGSWGVGRIYFEVQTEDNRMFRLYYDRAPTDAMDRQGNWILLAELNWERVRA